MAEDAIPYQLASGVHIPSDGGGWGDTPTIAPRSFLERPLAALRRYKWLALALFLLALTGGIVALRYIRAEYEVRATISIQSETPMQDRSGPMRSRELLNSGAWVELLKSYRISDAVVRKLALYVKADKDADSTVLRNFSAGSMFIPGTYTLKVDKKRTRWNLALEDAPVTDSGAVGDSIGRRLGFQWLPTPAVLSKIAGKEMKFTVSTPRETSIQLIKRLNSKLTMGSNFMWLSLQDPNPQLAARTMNTWVTEYVGVAAELKRKNLTDFASILGGQLQFAEASLHEAEAALENFRVHTITLPAEGAPVAAGLEMTRDPAMRSFFEKKIEYDNLRHDREQLEKTIAGAAAGTTPYQSLLLIPSVVQSPVSKELQQSFELMIKYQADINSALQIYKADYPPVKDLQNALNTLKTKTVPAQAEVILGQMREREKDLEGRIGNQSNDLEAIPTRTIEEMRLRRQVAVAEGLFTTLKSRHAEAKLAEASASPDVDILDSAVAPLKPTKNTAPFILGVAVLGGLAVAIGMALLLDKMDKRIRYPEQSQNDLGLPINGTVPQLPKGGADNQTPEQISQLVESFRTLRMNVMNTGGRQIALAVSSPSPGDGKSFITSNLAMSFADAGFRTLLVDGDTRRGTLHDLFGVPRALGLTDYLSGAADQSSIVHATGYENLMFVPTGTLHRRSPELLTSPALAKLVAELRGRYDVVLFDTPPLAAGVDAYAIAAATGSLLVVLRIGQTERRMAATKLALVDRLPITVIGSVLNAAPTDGEYEYYGYVAGYGTEEFNQSGKQVAQIEG
ncbi:MAG: polysaccharide biosynthesis tyrosine autokinase [Gemmatimonadota bacterium]